MSETRSVELESLKATLDKLGKELITVLDAKDGFDEHALSDISVPLVNEESKRCYMGLFLDAAHHFTTSNPPTTISEYVDRVVAEPLHTQIFGPSQASIEEKKANVESRLLSILGTWLGLSALFREGAGRMRLRPILLEHNRSSKIPKERSLKVSIDDLLGSCVFIPKKSDQKDLELPEKVNNADEVLDLIESTSLDAILLNTITLKDYAQVEVRWVNNISRHMILSNRTGHNELEVFQFPEVIRIKHPLHHTHEFLEYMEEVWKSYSLLFPVTDAIHQHGFFKRHILRARFCPCKSCTLRRAFEKHNSGCKYATTAFFKALEVQRKSWNTDEFPILWHRILKLRDHQAKSKPATVRALWKDRRHPVQFYGILFAAVVIPFSIVSIALAAATLKFAIYGPNVPPSTTTATHP